MNARSLLVLSTLVACVGGAKSESATADSGTSSVVWPDSPGDPATPGTPGNTWSSYTSYGCDYTGCFSHRYSYSTVSDTDADTDTDSDTDTDTDSDTDSEDSG